MYSFVYTPKSKCVRSSLSLDLGIAKIHFWVCIHKLFQHVLLLLLFARGQSHSFLSLVELHHQRERALTIQRQLVSQSPNGTLRSRFAENMDLSTPSIHISPYAIPSSFQPSFASLRRGLTAWSSPVRLSACRFQGRR